jgi:SNF2 family DNA or RNA helicase
MALLIIFCSLIVASLLTVSLANQLQTRNKVRRLKFMKLKRRVEELEDLVTVLDSLVESRAIPKLINDEAIEILRVMVSLDENASFLENSLNGAQKRSEELCQESASRQIFRLQESDVQLARTHLMLTDAAQILRQQQSRGHITVEELDAFINELAWTKLQVDVITYIAQGHKILSKGDVLNSHAFYRKAQQMLIHSKHPDARRHRMIKEVSELLTQKRQALSKDLMPETRYNPGETTTLGEQPSSL